ncbi:MAG: Rpn family recombination-promoting nuclease/putative transposase [Planctomycetes bacterium]|nr:Rpn family recombination-promoting nuclease/putative transposase [Planctomycetota bacterium]
MGNPPTTHPDSSRNPHGALFRTVFRDPAQAGPLLQSQLPEELAAGIDWPTLRHLDGSFLAAADERQGFADLIFAVTIDGRDGFVYLLLDMVRDDRAIHRLVADGAAALLDRWAKDHPGATVLPQIVPYVVRV